MQNCSLRELELVAESSKWDDDSLRPFCDLQVCEIVTESSDPDAAVQTMLEQALEAWEDRIASDNISMVVVKLDWGAEEPETTCSSTSADISAEASTIAEQDLRTRSPP